MFGDEQHGGVIGCVAFFYDVGWNGFPLAIFQVLPLVRAIFTNPETGLEYVAVVAARFPRNTEAFPRGRGHFLRVEPLVVQRAGKDRKSTRLELQSPDHLVCRLLLEKKKKKNNNQSRAEQRTT